MNFQNNSYIIGIGGGTSSGKTTTAKAISKVIGKENIVYLKYDNYYLDLSNLSIEERKMKNFDHPSSLDTNLFINDIRKLKTGKSIEMPIYDFVTHTRKKETIKLESKKIILVEGILVLHSPELRDLMDIKLFVDTAADERFIRRLSRDLKERGRNTQEVIEQYQNTVKPMHNQFIEPTKIYADMIIPSGYNVAAVNMVVNAISNIIQKSLENESKKMIEI